MYAIVRNGRSQTKVSVGDVIEIDGPAEPGATVTGIATEHGFLELGRFAMRYRRQFGETPSQTLARRTGPF